VILDDAMVASRAGHPTEGFAWIRSGHAAAQHRNNVFVFGGVVVREGRKTSELLVLNTDIMGWRVSLVGKGVLGKQGVQLGWGGHTC